MLDREPTLLLTRPQAQSAEFLAQCERIADRRLPAVVSPVMQIEMIGDIPDLDRFRTIVFTSGNGVRSLVDRASLRGRKVATVGERTSTLARTHGADAKALGDDVDTFVANCGGIEDPILFCRGTHSRGELAERLRSGGVQVEEAIIYDQAARELSAAAAALVAGSGQVIAPLFSSRSAELLSGHEGMSAPIRVIAMSEAVAKAWTGPGDIVIAKAPTAAEMAALTAAHF